jgi:hypothetical protein
MNRKGGERILFVYWFAIAVIVTIGIVAGVLKVAGSNMDVRLAETGLLRDRLVDCLINQGEFNMAVFNDLESYDDETLLQACKIDLEDKTQKYKGTEQYAVELGLYDENLNLIEKKQFGNFAFFVSCGVAGEGLVCLERMVYVLEKGRGRFLKINIAIDKNEKN